MRQILNGCADNARDLGVIHSHAVNHFGVAVNDEICVVRGEDNLAVQLPGLDKAVTNASGVATFTVKSPDAYANTFRATDVTDTVVVTQTATVTFTAP